ncbi:aldehyde-activating protein [Sphingomonas spermidinifaciens]|uniref:Aldehyde-activating protein n=1 Tax=Sphingomonas spermidinifaciens TaxID=1141889 RepID=A0A2A4B655_9SPHN|nr:GFA family protein [Sphingomonas spermidinifaciens]PCD03432.1 aldehyde-activating protein [Sphingomonas spermidinifaciens]
MGALPASGGCQCGAVRYRITAVNAGSPHICHCRMCQRAVGGPFAALFGVPDEAIEWTHGAPAVWRSSAAATRGFCANCGTPLFYHGDDSGRFNLTIASLDDPEVFAPETQMGVEGKLAWFDALPSLPSRGETGSEDAEWAERIAASNRQYQPD